MTEKYSPNPDVDRDVRQAFSIADLARASGREWEQKWILSLAVANGGGLLALFTAMVSDKRPWELLPCGVFFLFGLLCAGFTPYAITRSRTYEANHFWGAGQHKLSKFTVDHGGTIYENEEYIDEMGRRWEWWKRAVEVGALVSGASFGLGGMLGLVLLTLKLFRIT